MADSFSPMPDQGLPESTPLAAALAYAKTGWPVFPLAPGTKVPLAGSRGFLDATTDVARIQSWWREQPRANIGLATGSRSGVDVVDEDPRNGGDAAALYLPPTRMANSPSGGRHFYFAHPGGHLPKDNKGKIARGIDVLADGAYVLLPPSRLADERRYSWLDPQAGMAPLPDWITLLLRPEERAPLPPVPAHSNGNGHLPYADDGRKWLAEALERAHEGNAEPTGYWLAQQLAANRVASFEGILREYARDATFRPDDPFTQRDVQRWMRQGRDSLIGQRGDPARSRSAASIATHAAAAVLHPATPVDHEAGAQPMIGTPESSTGNLTTRLLEAVSAAGDAHVVWDHLQDIAMLDQAQWGQTRAALKSALGKDLNLNDLERALREARKQARRAAREQRVSDEGLPVIDVTDRPLRDITTDAVNALHDANTPPVVYVRSGALSRVRAREDGRPVIDLMTEPIVRGRLARVASFVRASESGPSHISPPEDVVRDVLALGEWQFPPLVGITESPVLRPDGSIVSRPGYDAATRLIYAPPDDFELPDIPAHPTADDVRTALAFVEEVIHDFPFVDRASHANAIALLLSPIVRPALGESNTPLALLDAPKAGTGKGLLAQAVATIATGRQNAIITAPGDEDEWRKRITAVLSMGATIINIDNLEGRFASSNVAAALTTASWQDRVLGRSETITLSQRATWLATGNNIRLGGDMPRRCYWIRMDAKMARPYERGRDQFKHAELLVWIAAHRGELLAALLTVARGWYAATCPPAPETLAIGSFEQWCHVLSGILAYAGASDFLGNLGTMHDQVDDDTPEWEHFLITWHETYAARIFTVAELAREFETPHAALREALPGYLAAAYNKPGGSFTRALGKALAAQTDVRYGSAGLHLVRAGEFRRAVRWRVLDDQHTAGELSADQESVEQSSLSCEFES